MMAAATEKTVMPISTAGKRWDTTTPSAWSNKNKNQNKKQNNNKINNSGSNVTTSAPADSYTHAAPTAASA
jgi:hypothetical protein